MASQLDIYYLELHNIARANPAQYAASLGIDLNEGLSPGTINPLAKQPVVFNADLKTMAVAHSQDELDNDFWSHTSPTTGTTEDRFNASNYVYTKFGENLGLVPTSSVQNDYAMAKLMFETLFIDAGVTGRGHRRSILDADFREVGFGHLIGDFQGNTLSHMLTICYGLSPNAYNTLCGMVMQDLNQNGKYDIGEGIGGNITVDAEIGGVVQATTTADGYGYYQINLDPGTYDIKARTTDHDAVQLGIDISSYNVKQDLYWDTVETGLPIVNFYTDTTHLRLQSYNPEVQSLTPINIIPSGDTEYTLVWSTSNTYKVVLDGEEVGLSGTKKIQATDAFIHVLIAYGSAGQIRQELPIQLSVFEPFNSGDPERPSGLYYTVNTVKGWYGSGSVQWPTASGLHHLYGPSEEQSLTIKEPDKLYTRIAEVVRVSAYSRELDIRFLDGSVPDTNLYRAEVLFGVYNRKEDEEPIVDTPTPSAAIVGKGDRVAVMVMNDIYLVVSKLDRFEYPNNNRVAVYPYNILYSILNTFCIGAHFVEDGYSYADFIDPETYLVTRVESYNPNELLNRIPWRLLRQLNLTHLQNINLVHIDDAGYPYENAGGGALPTQPILINDTIRHKNMINNIPYVQDLEFGRTDYTGDSSIYSETYTGVERRLCHPLAEDTIVNHYSGATFFWMDDPDPEWVLVATAYPSWDTCNKIKFLEVPVYGWSERARNDNEDNDLIQDILSNKISYLRREDLVREIFTIDRNYIDWSVFDNSIDYSERVHRAVAICAKKLGINYWVFDIRDGYGYSNGSSILYGANEQKLVSGHVTRSINQNGLASNGSPYEYNIFYNPPSTVSVWYDLDVKYYSDSFTNDVMWESQKTTEEQETRHYTIYSNGDDRLFKKVTIDFYCDGGYDWYPWMGEKPGYVNLINNKLREYWYWNSTENLVATYEWDYTYNVTGDLDKWRVVQSIPVMHYANIEQGIFIMEIIEMNFANTLGYPAPLLEGTRNRRFIVWYRGTQYTLFNVEIPYTVWPAAGADTFPQVYNHWPWQLDANFAQKPDNGPYDIQLLESTGTAESTIFYLSPFGNYYLEPLSPYLYKACSYPSFAGDISSTLFVGAINPEEADLHSDYIQVFYDPKSNSWAVTIKNILEIKDNRVLTFPDGGGSTAVWPHGMNTLFKIGDNAPTFNKPSVDTVIQI